MSDQPLTDEQLAGWVEHSDPFPPYWEAEHDNYLDAMAAELLAARAGLADKSARITALKAAIAGLEAAQRPPLGYVVGTRTADGIALAKPYTWVEEMRAGAEQDLANAIEEDGPDAGYQLLEVREVQP